MTRAIPRFRTPFAVLGFALLSTVTVRPATGQTPNGSVTAHVTDTSGAAIYAATVRIGGTPLIGVTGASGAFHFEHVQREYYGTTFYLGARYGF